MFAIYNEAKWDRITINNCNLIRLKMQVGKEANGTLGNVAKDRFACVDSRVPLRRKPATIMAPSPVSKPFSSRLHSSKKRTQVSAKLPGGRAAWTLARRSPLQKSAYGPSSGTKARFRGSAAKGLSSSRRIRASTGLAKVNVTTGFGSDIRCCTRSGTGNDDVTLRSGAVASSCIWDGGVVS